MPPLFDSENRSLDTMASQRASLMREREALLALRLVETKRFLERQRALLETQEQLRVAARGAAGGAQHR